MTVLVVDDTQINITLLSHLVSKIENCIPVGFTDPVEGLAWCNDHEPDLVMLDYMMPVMDGIEFLRRFRELPGRADIPVLMVTANDQVALRHKALEAGANDFLTKPIDKIEFSARVRNMLALRASQRRLAQSNQILTEEKELLEDIVTRMRSSSPFDGQGIRYILSSLERTAGDIVLSAFRPDGAQHVLVGDFSGHGLPAAFGGPLASWIFYYLTQEGYELERIIKEINRTLSLQLPTQLYMAAGVLELSADRRRAKLWNYGLPPLLYFDGKGETGRLKSAGVPLGILQDGCEFAPHLDMDVAAGTCFYQYSDGLTEAESPDGEQYGTDRLEALVARIRREHLPLEEIWSELEIFCAGLGLSDDAVMVEVAA